jgi:hypothetical protein
VKHRLDVDEVGNADLNASSDPNHRYLSLTGVIIELDYVQKALSPQLEAIKKRYFGSHPDEPICLHRKELVNRRPPFAALRDPILERAFNSNLLQLLRVSEYTVITVVIDKLEHQQRYQIWRYDPYHYALAVLVERFIAWLREHSATGDVMAESRGGNEDRRLKDSFEGIYERGTDYVRPDEFARWLTSKQLKVKSKDNNIAGLQLADIIAHPSFKASLARHAGHTVADNFGGEIAKILEEQKYYRNYRGKIDGWGRKWLP